MSRIVGPNDLPLTLETLPLFLTPSTAPPVQLLSWVNLWHSALNFLTSLTYTPHSLLIRSMLPLSMRHLPRRMPTHFPTSLIPARLHPPFTTLQPLFSIISSILITCPKCSRNIFALFYSTEFTLNFILASYMFTCPSLIRLSDSLFLSLHTRLLHLFIYSFTLPHCLPALLIMFLAFAFALIQLSSTLISSLSSIPNRNLRLLILVVCSLSTCKSLFSLSSYFYQYPFSFLQSSHRPQTARS